jgi:hypothetical protein
VDSPGLPSRGGGEENFIEEKPMSYIRCLSNPEGMYIYGGADGVWISHNVKPPLASKEADDGCSPHFVVPSRDFDRLGLKWAKDWAYDEHVRSGKLAAQQVHVYLDTGKPVEKNWANRFFRKGPKRPSAFLIKLSYGRHFVMMWRVTWHYIVQNIVGTTGGIKRKRAKAKKGRKP